MAKVLVTESYLSAIASAIRSKAGTTQTFTPAQMASAINAIPTGYTVKQVLEGTASFLKNTYVDNETTALARGAYAFNDNIRSVTFNSCSIVGGCAFYACHRLTTASFPVCTNISSWAFSNCTSLTTISFPICTTISSYAFCDCDALTTISFPSCQSIGSYAFSACTSIREISLPECLYVDDNAFRMTDSAYPARQAFVTSIDLPKCQSIGNYAFHGIGSLTSINLPACTFVGEDAFRGTTKNLSFLSLPSCVSIGAYAFFTNSANQSLASLDLPVCTSIGANAFTSFAFLRSVSLPECLSIGSYAFRYCSSLSTVSLPRCSRINSAAFGYCEALTSVRLDAIDAALFYIGSEAFAKCYNLLSLYLLSDSVGTLTSTNAFTSTPISTYTASTGGVQGSIFVRASLLTAYQSAARWSTYKSRFVGLTDAEIAALG